MFRLNFVFVYKIPPLPVISIHLMFRLNNISQSPKENIIDFNTSNVSVEFDYSKPIELTPENFNTSNVSVELITVTKRGKPQKISIHLMFRLN